MNNKARKLFIREGDKPTGIININQTPYFYTGHLPQLGPVQPEAEHEEAGAGRHGPTRAGTPQGL